MTAHSQRAYDEELRELRSLVSRMGGLLANQLEKAIVVLAELDEDGAEALILNDAKIDKYEWDAEKAAIGVIARRAPVANDLIEIVATLKVTTRFERMGDYVKHIADQVSAIAEGGPVVVPGALQDLALACVAMIHDVIDAHLDGNGEVAAEVIEREDTIETLYCTACRQLVDRMKNMPNQVTGLAHYLMITRNLRYIGREAAAVAADVSNGAGGEVIGGEVPAEIRPLYRPKAH